jgi:hypothetical protein
MAVRNRWVISSFIFLPLDLSEGRGGHCWSRDRQGRARLPLPFLLSASSLAVLAASTLVVALVADCFAIAALVLRLGLVALLASGRLCHTRLSEENQVHTYMHARIKFHAYSDI